MDRNRKLKSAVCAGYGLALVAGAAGLASVSCPPVGPGHSPTAWSLATVLYLPLVLALFFLLRLGAGLGIPGRLAAGFAVAGTFLVFLRGQTDVVHLASKPLAGVALVGVVGLLASVLPVGRGRSKNASLIGLGSSVAVLVALLLLACSFSGWRWHLFAHQRFLGSLAAHLTGGTPQGSPEEVLSAADLDLRPARSLASPRQVAPRDAGGPSIALILIDTLRADSLWAYGGDRDRMPLLERLAAESVVFRDVWANATWTRPSVASVFTGELPEHVGVLDEDDPLPEEVFTLAERLRASGYRTAAFMSNPHLYRKWGFAQGFDEFFELRGSGGYPRGEIVTSRVERWLTERDPDARPTFLYVHYMDPHTPYRSGTPSRLHLAQFDRGAYDAELRYLDGHLASLIDSLRTALGPELLVAVTSDHGEEFGEHGRYGHGQSVYPELSRIPLVVHYPRAPPDIIEHPLEGRDIFHLLSDLSSQPDLEPRSWVKSQGIRSRSVSSYKTPRSALVRALRPYDVIRVRGVERGGQLVLWNDFGDIYEAYDLIRDPGAHWNQLSPIDRDAAPGLIDSVVGFWTEPRERAIDHSELEDLRALGYLN